MEQTAKLANQLGRYRLVSTLGQGGMGTIWLAVAGGLGEFRKLLVIKELRWDLTRNPRFVEMFFDEVKLAARLNHPNVVQTLEAGQEGGRYFLSMEFLDGQPLSEVMQRATQDPSITLAVRLRILCGALAGLHYAHELRDYDGTELQIVHRDVSPHNVFVTYDGQVKVVDFGIAKAADADSFTQPGVFKGKLAYASPEQIKGEPVDRRADVFAMGVLLWELVTLARFAKGKPSQHAFDARVAGLEPRLSQLDFDVEPLLAEICDRAISIDPAARFATAEQFRHALEQYLFVSGERVDSSALASVMQSAFAAERAAMHRTIDAHLKEAEYSESLVRQLRPLPAAALTSEEPTTVADLSELVESSRADLPTRSESDTNPGWNRALRKKNRTAWWALATVAAIIAITVYAMPRPSSAPIPAAAAPAPSPPPSVPPAPPPARAEQPAQLAAPPVELAVEAPAAPSEQAPAQASEEQRSSTRARRAKDREVEDEADALGEEESAGLMFGFGFSGSDDDEPVESEEAKLDDLPPASLRIVPSPESPELSKTASDDVRIGEDLRSLRKDSRRQLDLEDPYQ